HHLGVPALDPLLDLVLAADARLPFGRLLEGVVAADRFDDLLFLAVLLAITIRRRRLGRVLVRRVLLAGSSMLGVFGMLGTIVRFVACLGRLDRFVIVRMGGRFAFGLVGVGRLRRRVLLLDGFAGDERRFTALVGRVLVMMPGRRFVLVGVVSSRRIGGRVGRRGGFGRVLGDRRAAHGIAAASGAAFAAAPGAAGGPRLGLALRPLFLGDQRLPVGDRNLVVIGMDFAEGKEAVAVAAVLDERRLQRRLDPGYLGEIDVAAQLAAARRFEGVFLDAVGAPDHPPG